MFFATNMWGQSDSILFRVSVFDSFTEDPLPANITVMNSDSSVIATYEATYDEDWKQYVVWSTIPRRSRFILKAERDGYETSYVNVKFGKWEKERVLENIFLNKNISDFFTLGEVTVKASRVKMVYDGDTIIYNANAFRLSNGSMLDALIKSLPGVEINENGIITVNGEFVSELLVNGRHFFQGDPVVALKNLPAYYVNKVKAYHQVSKYKKFLHGDTLKAEKNEDPLVMDVILKREYQEGWLANAEVARGTEKLYLYRLFGMRYTPKTGLYFFGNVNNVNDSKLPSRNGVWGNNQWSEGVVETKTAGINYNFEDKKTGTEFDMSFRLNSRKNDLQQKLSSVYFFTGGDVYNRSNTTNLNKNNNLDWNAKFTYPGNGKPLYLSLSSYFRYTHQNNHHWNRFASLDDDPQDAYIGETIDSLFFDRPVSRLQHIWVNQREIKGFTRNNKFNFGGSVFSSIRCEPLNPTLYVEGQVVDEKQKTFNIDDLQYNQIKTSLNGDFQNKYENNPSYSSNLLIRLSSDIIRNNKNKLEFRYSFITNHSSGKRNLYRLDEYYKRDKSFGSIGLLPSTTDSLQQVIDVENSYHTISDDVSHEVMLLSTIKRKSFNYTFSFPVEFAHQKINDVRNNEHKSYDRNIVSVSPSFNVNWYYFKDEKNTDVFFQLKYGKNKIPMLYFLERRDSSNPLSLSLGNSDLNDTEHISAWFMLNRQDKASKTNSKLQWNYDLAWNSISMSRRYESTSGRSVYKPLNIDGNWSTSLSYQFSTPLDKNQHTSFANQMSVSYINSEDYVTDVKSFDEDGEPKRSGVRNLRLSEKVRLDWSVKSMALSFNGRINYSYAKSSIEAISKINVYDFSYGAAITTPLLWGVDFNADCTMWMHRGYSDSSMNFNEFVVNASLSYACFKEKKLVFKLSGHDIFNQVKSVYYSVNSQGRIEKWYNTIPSYVMLSATYRFNKKPQKKSPKMQELYEKD